MFRWHRHLSKCFDRMQTALLKWNKTMSVIAVNFFFWGSVGEEGKPTGGPLIVNHVETWRERTERKGKNGDVGRGNLRHSCSRKKEERRSMQKERLLDRWSVFVLFWTPLRHRPDHKKEKKKLCKWKGINREKTRRATQTDAHTHTKAKQNNSFRPYKAF